MEPVVFLEKCSQVMISAVIQGIPDLNSKFERVLDAIDKPEIEPIVMAGARKMRGHVRRGAPKGHTGNLKRGVQAKKLQRRYGYPVAAVVQPNWKKAPHTRWVNEGIGHIRVPTEKARKLAPGSTWFWPGHGRVSNTGRMGANPFYKSAFDTYGSTVRAEVTAKVKAKIDGAIS